MSLFEKFSRISRQRKLELFKKLMRPTHQMRVLDVGAEVDPGGDHTLQFIDRYQWRDRIAAVNISQAHIAIIKRYYPEVDARVADAGELPWPDKYFDVVYSNAVIEHVGGLERQKRMASEIMRVGKSWFVTTPNRWYPYEFHIRLPFVTWLPFHGYRYASLLVSYDHVHKKYVVGHKRKDIRLLSASQLASCFPGSRIVKLQITFWPETLVAVGGKAILDIPDE